MVVGTRDRRVPNLFRSLPPRIGNLLGHQPTRGGTMRKLETIAAGLVVSLAAAGTASAGVLEHQTLKGKAADVEFLISTPETCADGSAGSIDNSVSLFGEDSLISSHQNGNTLINALSATVVVA